VLKTQICVTRPQCVKVYGGSGGTLSLLTSGERATGATEYKASWLPQSIWTFRIIHKSSVPAGKRTLIRLTSNLWLSHCIDWAIPAPTYWSRAMGANDGSKLTNIIRNIHWGCQRMRSVKCNIRQMIKYNLWQISNCYMFRQRSAFLRETTRTKEYESNTPADWRVGFWPKRVAVGYLQWIVF